jgi:hypothetical protein
MRKITRSKINILEMNQNMETSHVFADQRSNSKSAVYQCKEPGNNNKDSSESKANDDFIYLT